MKVDSFVDFYEDLKLKVDEELKNNISNSTAAVENTDCTSKKSLLEAVKSYSNILNSHARTGIVHYIRFGEILLKLKLLYWRRCEDCKNEESLEYISCKRCSQISDSKDFFDDVYKVYPYKSSYINFIIRIYRLGHQYHKFKYIPLSVSVIIHHIGNLEKKMANDKDFWCLNVR